MSNSRHKPNWLGKPVAEMKAETAAYQDTLPMTQRCLFCKWTYKGNTADGRTEALAHRQLKHPEAVGRKTYRKSRAFRVDVKVDDLVIETQRRDRLAREEADRLATIERGRLRREQAA